MVGSLFSKRPLATISSGNWLWRKRADCFFGRVLLEEPLDVAGWRVDSCGAAATTTGRLAGGLEMAAKTPRCSAAADNPSAPLPRRLSPPACPFAEQARRVTESTLPSSS